MIECLAAADAATPLWKTILQVEHGWQVAWVMLGLAGQLLYFARMGLQWIATERRRQSYVPAAFWWCSFFGSIMLLTYFIWRREPIGTLGQSFGFVVYARNLYFIYSQHETHPPLA